jgi:WD40-like Beta Propeller Repeat
VKTPRLLLRCAVAVVLVGCSPEETIETPCGAGVICAKGPDTGVRTDAATADRAAPNDLGPARDAEPMRDAVAIREVTRIVVDPPAATLTVRDGVAATQVFTVVGTFNDGTSRPLANGTWSMPATLAAAVDPNSGVVTAGGRAGGVATLTVRVPGPGGMEIDATAAVTVRVERSVLVDRLVPDVIDNFARPAVADRARQATVRYPLDRAVIPTNLPAPDVQWEGGVAGDLYRVRIEKPHVAVNAYVQHSGTGFGYHWAVDPEAWRTLLESDPADPLSIVIDRWDNAARERIDGESISLRVARAVLSGTIYYWDLSSGRLMRLDALTGGRSLAIANPPPKPPGPGGGSRCIACHTISRDGRYLSAEMWGGDEPSVTFDLTSARLSDDPAPTVYGPRDEVRYLFSTFSPDSTYLVVNRGNAMRLLDRATGTFIADSGLPTDHAAHPDWSPDGMSVAFVTNTNMGWAVDFTRGDLAVLPRTTATTFGAPRVVHRGTTDAAPPADALVTDAHPTFSPDSQWIAFQHGTNSRGGNEGTHYPGRLEIASAEATPDRASTVLVNANGSGEPDSYWPNFSPFNEGGYFWVAFYSRRDYGNAQVGTRGTRRRQIWVAAVANHPTEGADPSQVPYWLPGQDTALENMSAYWAPIACRMNTERCSVSSECCSGLCDRGADTVFVCTPPPPAMCRREGTTCSTSTDCCNGLMCFNRVCGRDPG